MAGIKENSLKYNLHSWSAQGKLNPSVITKAEGIYFWDEDGNQYMHTIRQTTSRSSTPQRQRKTFLAVNQRNNYVRIQQHIS